jgi:hypothetical protein
MGVNQLKKYVILHLTDNGWKVEMPHYDRVYVKDGKTIIVEHNHVNFYFRGYYFGKCDHTNLLTDCHAFIRYFVEGDNMEQKPQDPLSIFDSL